MTKIEVRIHSDGHYKVRCPKERCLKIVGNCGRCDNNGDNRDFLDNIKKGFITCNYFKNKILERSISRSKTPKEVI